MFKIEFGKWEYQNCSDYPTWIVVDTIEFESCPLAYQKLCDISMDMNPNTECFVQLVDSKGKILHYITHIHPNPMPFSHARWLSKEAV